MIDPDVIGERRTANHTPTIALGLAAVLLLVVGALSYRDSVRSSLEKEYAEREATLMQRMGYPAAQPGMTATDPQAANGAPSPGPASGQSIPSGTTVLYDAQGNPVYLSGTQPSQGNAGLLTEANLPAPVDPEISQFQQSLEQARKQSEITDQRFNQLAGGGDPLAAEAAALSANGVTNPAGGNATSLPTCRISCASPSRTPRGAIPKSRPRFPVCAPR